MSAFGYDTFGLNHQLRNEDEVPAEEAPTEEAPVEEAPTEDAPEDTATDGEGEAIDMSALFENDMVKYGAIGLAALLVINLLR